MGNKISFCKLLFILLLPLFESGCDEIERHSNIPSPNVKIIAHCGYWNTSGSAKNSISSLENAGKLGVYGTEFDVWMTKDGKLVVCHDDNFCGMTIYNTDYDELRNPIYTLPNGETLPSLDDYLITAKKYPGMHLVIEFKSSNWHEYNIKGVELVYDAICKYEVKNRVDFISFSMDACMLMREKDSEIVIEYLGNDYTIEDLFKKSISGIDYNYSTILDNPDCVCQAHSLGMFVNSWTVNSFIYAEQLVEMGVDMITTDDPKSLNNFFY